MHYSNFFLLGLLTAGAFNTAIAQDVSEQSPVVTESIENQLNTQQKTSTLQAIKDLKKITKDDLKVNANAAQPDAVKDPLQPLNRQIFAFNDTLDRYVLKPVAIQYVEKVPEPVRSPYRQFRKNLGEPWNAVNQLIQGRPSRAAKTLGRFTLNTLTTLGFADPARRLGLPTEEESFGVTLGYYGVPSGPYLMLPILGPSTLRNSLDYVSNAYATPTNHILARNDQYGVEWSNAALGGIDSRSQFLDLDGSLRGDRYAALRDIYLQRKSFEIAEKKGDNAEAIGFIDDDLDDDIDEDQLN